MIEIVPVNVIGAAEIKILREISALSISQIKNASKKRLPIKSFEIFGGDWEEQRIELVSIYHLYSSSQNVPFVVVDTDSGEQKQLTSEELFGCFKFWRSIELETQKNSDLEMGYISDPSEFEAHDEDWA